MKNLLFIILFIALVPQALFSQSRELGIMAGGSFYMGDLNTWLPFKGTRPAIGVFYRKHTNTRFAYKFNFNYGNLYASDAKSNNDYQQYRNLDFKSFVAEGSAQFEFNFLKFHGDDYRYPFSPYLFGGIGLFAFYPKGSLNGSYEPLRKNATEAQGAGTIYRSSNYSMVQLCLPFGMGVKYQLNKRFNVGFEWGMRKTFTDYLDDVSRYYVYSGSAAASFNNNTQSLSDKTVYAPGDTKLNSGRQRGNFGNKDWYSFAGLTISIKFNDPLENCPAFN